MACKDTQWPRYEVFQQQRPDGPYQNVGSVHAPDAEIALQNARDVFVRRPQTVGLWVVPAGAILARTSEALAEDESWRQPAVDSSGSATERYYVFQKRSQRRSMAFVTYAGEVEAATATQALARACELYGEEPVYVWWIVPATAIVGSTERDVASMFEPAHEKDYRLPGAYHTRTLMREVTRQGDESEG